MIGRPLLLLAALLCAAPAAAHDLWIEPSTFHPAVGATVAVRLQVGQNFVGEPLPRSDRLVERFVLSSSDGDRAIDGQDGDEPAGSIVIPSSGVHLVGYRSNNSYVSLEPQKFEDYLKDEGLERIVALRGQRGQSQMPSREFFARCAKALVSANGLRTGFDRILGFTLEIIPEKDPEGWRPRKDLPFRLLYEGRPLAGALVVAMPRQTPAEKLSARTDGNGRVAFALPHAGVWLVKAVHMLEADGRKADWQSLWASLIFEIPDRPLAKSPR
jgi:uncharacterized GH25 family protein